MSDEYSHDYDGYTPPKIEWTCKQCGTIHEEKPHTLKINWGWKKNGELCPDCDDYEVEN